MSVYPEAAGGPAFSAALPLPRPAAAADFFSPAFLERLSPRP
jgi:hypothetical protein